MSSLKNLMSLNSSNSPNKLQENEPLLYASSGHMLSTLSTDTTSTDHTSATTIRLTHLLCTHRHHDHTGGNLVLKKNFPDLIVCGYHGANIPGRHTRRRALSCVYFRSFMRIHPYVVTHIVHSLLLFNSFCSDDTRREGW